jgi:hypothetical protein
MRAPKSQASTTKIGRQEAFGTWSTSSGDSALNYQRTIIFQEIEKIMSNSNSSRSDIRKWFYYRRSNLERLQLVLPAEIVFASIFAGSAILSFMPSQERKTTNVTKAQFPTASLPARSSISPHACQRFISVPFPP